ncbi:MAG: hypothetical protein EZS28_054636 [Streblomastix strix]|uniref:Uncharacterized protein n=1 Tax=Streblomastix strix TaxID=222440 RepID=A0A5J4QIK9_9EUKA|nr:MAG: hypothetical protein EZS28_054636 [Streblomastix strix]
MMLEKDDLDRDEDDDDVELSAKDLGQFMSKILTNQQSIKVFGMITLRVFAKTEKVRCHIWFVGLRSV